MAYRVEVSEDAEKDLSKLDKQVSRRIANKIAEIAALDDPRSRGKALKGSMYGLWRYRAGDYRIVCDIHDDILVIVIVEIEHRSKVYDRR